MQSLTEEQTDGLCPSAAALTNGPLCSNGLGLLPLNLDEPGKAPRRAKLAAHASLDSDLSPSDPSPPLPDGRWFLPVVLAVVNVDVVCSAQLCR